MNDNSWAQRWDDIPKKGSSKGLIPGKLQEVVERGRSMSPLERLKFKRDLWKTALKRITDVRAAWASLRQHEVDSFASIWAHGHVEQYVKGMTGRATGLVQPTVAVGRLLERRDLNPDIREDLMMLIDDTVTYIEITLNWSQTVRRIRSIEPGTLENIDPFQQSNTAQEIAQRSNTGQATAMP